MFFSGVFLIWRISLLSFHILQFRSSLMFVILKSLLVMLLLSSVGVHTLKEALPQVHITSSHCDALPFYFSSYTINKCPSVIYLLQCVSQFRAFNWWFCCLKGPPTIVLKCCPVFTSPRRPWFGYLVSCVPDEFCSGMSNSVFGHDFNVNESRTYIKEAIFKQKHT